MENNNIFSNEFVDEQTWGFNSSFSDSHFGTGFGNMSFKNLGMGYKYNGPIGIKGCINSETMRRRNFLRSVADMSNNFWNTVYVSLRSLNLLLHRKTYSKETAMISIFSCTLLWVGFMLCWLIGMAFTIDLSENVGLLATIIVYLFLFLTVWDRVKTYSKSFAEIVDSDFLRYIVDRENKRLAKRNKVVLTKEKKKRAREIYRNDERIIYLKKQSKSYSFCISLFLSVVFAIIAIYMQSWVIAQVLVAVAIMNFIINWFIFKIMNREIESDDD